MRLAPGGASAGGRSSRRPEERLRAPDGRTARADRRARRARRARRPACGRGPSSARAGRRRRSAGTSRPSSSRTAAGASAPSTPAPGSRPKRLPPGRTLPAGSSPITSGHRPEMSWSGPPRRAPANISPHRHVVQQVGGRPRLTRGGQTQVGGGHLAHQTTEDRHHLVELLATVGAVAGLEDQQRRAHELIASMTEPMCSMTSAWAAVGLNSTTSASLTTRTVWPGGQKNRSPVAHASSVPSA